MKRRESLFWEDKETKPTIIGEEERRESTSNFICCIKCRACQKGSCNFYPCISVVQWLVDWTKQNQKQHIKIKLIFNRKILHIFLSKVNYKIFYLTFLTPPADLFIFSAGTTDKTNYIEDIKVFRNYCNECYI